MRRGAADELMRLSVRGLIDLRAESQPDAVWMIDPERDRSISYGQLREQARRVSGRLAETALPPGSHIGYAMANGLDAATALLGILYAGMRATAINLAAGPGTIAYVLQHSGAALVVHDEAGKGAVHTALADSPDRPELWSIEQCLSADARPAPPTDAAPAATDDALLMYTSGTTGNPKGVRLSQRNLISGGSNTATAHQLTTEDRALCVLPLYHINGLCVTLMAPLVSGGSVVMPKAFSVSHFWPTLERHGCSWFSVVPTQISYLLHDRPSHYSKPSRLRFGRSASAPLSPEVHQNFESHFQLPLVETMGLTETAAQILSNPLPPGERKVGSPGVAVGCEARIADPAGAELAAGVEGEIWIRGDNVMLGYRNNDEATREAIGADGWLRTGDLGKMDDEGYVYVTGRLKELIIKGGENIAPREIDDALYSHPAVIEAAAFARSCQDYGQRVEAGVVLSADAGVDAQALIAHCVERVGRFKAPDRIHLLGELPKGPSGKVQRRRLAESLLGD